MSKIFCERFNFKRANWKGFKDGVEHKLESINFTPENYDRFANVVGLAAHHNISSGCHSNYHIPGLTPSGKDLYSKYKILYEENPLAVETIAAGEVVIEAISESHRSTWQLNSRKAWQLVRKLTNDSSKLSLQYCNITANQIVHQLLLNGKVPHSIQQLEPRIHQKGFNNNILFKLSCERT